MKLIRTTLTATLLAFAAGASADTIELEVNGLVCAFCAQGIEKTLRKFPATQDVFVSLEHRLVAIEPKAGQTLDDDSLREAIADAGYATVKITRTDSSLEEIRNRVKKNHAAADD
jgi:copper chaperone CopZ